MSRFRLSLIIVICVLLIGGVTIWAAVRNGDSEEEIPLSNTPANVIEAANSAVTGGEITEVEMEVEDGETIYEVEKVVDGVEYEIEVTADGVVKEIEKEGEEEDDEEDDD
jgi:uncharacterized cupredoxin-like copper-binding protein